MRFGIIRTSGCNLARGTAILLAGGVLAGCSSSVSRFDGGLDDLFTASTANQRAIINAPQEQPFPGDRVASAPAAPARAAVAPVQVAAPVERSTLPAPAAVAPSSPRTAAVDTQATGTVSRSPEPAAPKGDRVAGWNGAGGSKITVRQGETVYNLSRRFGVPADAILKANGMADAGQLQAGREITIPTYAYGKNAPVSAPDNNPKVAAAKSGRETAPAAPQAPANAPEKLAVLPTVPRLGDKGDAAQQASVPPQSAKTAQDSGGYTVASGDSLYVIAKKTGTTTEALMAANGLSSPVLRVGQKLVIPQAKAREVAAVSSRPATVDPVKTATTAPNGGVSVEPAAYTPPRKEKLIDNAVENAAIAPESTGIDRMRWPVRGRVISAFGTQSGSAPNDGIDIAVPEGTPVKAAENGVVIYAGNGLKEFGNTVLVRHEDGLVTVYGHASEINVQRGDKVRRGQEIARSGMSGSTDTPKLHFEVRKDSAPVDPSTFLE